MRTASNLSVREVVENYIPRDSREEKDKQQMLRFIDNFDDVLTRGNTLGHFTASSFIVDKNKTKMLAIYHTIDNGWAHPGGHADGEKDFLSVAVREAKEETGLDVNVLDERPFLLSVNPVSGHMKKAYLCHHTCISMCFILWKRMILRRWFLEKMNLRA